MTGVAIRAKTRSEEVYAAVRREILAGRLRPGERLGPAVFAERLGVSLGVVREALTRLAEQGLVVAQPQIGFQVAPVSAEDLLDLTAVRIDVETLALRRAVESGDVSWESALVGAHHVLERTAQYLPDDPLVYTEEWARAHADYHEALLSACGSPRLLEIANSLRDSSELYRRWSQPDGAADTRDIAGEHRGILDAVLSRDADRAVSALRAHIQYTTDVLLELEFGEAAAGERPTA